MYLQDKMATFIEKCACIAEFHGFQGWLVNVEHPVEPHLIANLLHLGAVAIHNIQQTHFGAKRKQTIVRCD